jgi:ADP-ribose pyrophosphatase YjhB (NUDIX family)
MGETPKPSFSRRVPEGDSRTRSICDHCGFVDYVNPRIVVGAVCTWEDTILLCRRSIEPRRGFWTLPAGFLEEGETVEEGVLREAREEAGADLELDGLLGVYSVPRVSQVQLFYRARLRSPEVVAGEETLAVQLATWDRIPWDELAFPTVRWALGHFDQVRGRETFPPFSNPPGERGEMKG